MNSEFDTGAEPRERTWLIWVGVGLVLCIMVGALALQNRGNSKRSIVHCRHILITFDKSDPLSRERALEQITELRARILAGESFSRIAMDYSQDPSSARRGGDLNYSERGTYVDAFEAYVWSAPVGELSDVVETTFGFHLIRVDDRVISEVDRVVSERERAVREELEKQQQGGEEESPAP